MDGINESMAPYIIAFFKFTLFSFNLGNKAGKLKTIFEEIDTSGDNNVSMQELADFVEPNTNDKAGEILFREFSYEERQEFKKELMTIGNNDKNQDGKFSFKEFKEVVKDNEIIEKFILKIPTGIISFFKLLFLIP